mmetsp:Transcript_17128/g.16354  ORF Transcript_17128/g.16354 Transcript_17128/m.16354 type:complete len:88 (+) Transcript_17128:22-285(+)
MESNIRLLLRFPSLLFLDEFLDFFFKNHLNHLIYFYRRPLSSLLILAFSIPPIAFRRKSLKVLIERVFIVPHFSSQLFIHANVFLGE